MKIIIIIILYSLTVGKKFFSTFHTHAKSVFHFAKSPE